MKPGHHLADNAAGLVISAVMSKIGERGCAHGSLKKKGVPIAGEHRCCSLTVPPCHELGAQLFFGHHGDLEHGGQAALPHRQKPAAMGGDGSTVRDQIPPFQIIDEHDAKHNRAERFANRLRDFSSPLRSTPFLSQIRLGSGYAAPRHMSHSGPYAIFFQTVKRAIVMKDITWKVKLSQNPAAIYERLTTDQGRCSFWAERSHETLDGFELVFSNGQTTQVSVLETVAGQFFKVRYFEAPTSFSLEPIGEGTILTLKAIVSDDDYVETHAGWVSVLMALKAQVEGGIDLRNHARTYSWDQGFADN